MSAAPNFVGADPSKLVAFQIAEVFPDAIFCGFNVTRKTDGAFNKKPVSKVGLGVGKATERANLVPASEIKDSPPLGQFWGVSLHERTMGPFDDGVLTILDIDTKRTEAPTDVRIQRLMARAKALGLLTERSHSKKGAHIILFAKEDDTLPAKVDLGHRQEIEIFGQPKSGGKSVMLTGDELTGQVNMDPLSVRELFAECGITLAETESQKPVKTPSRGAECRLKTAHGDDMARAEDALRFIQLPEGAYAEWIGVGMALHEGFGEAGFQLWVNWSATQPGFKGDDDCRTHWKTFKPNGQTKLASMFHMAKQGGYKPKKTERPSAVQDFRGPIFPNVDPDTGEFLDVAEEDLSASVAALPLSVAFADELPEAFTPPDELVEGVLTAGDGSVLYGDSNSGKTFFVIDMAAAVARGVPWMGRNTEQGLVVYLAAESPASVRSRLQAYQKHHGVKVPNFAIVQSPIDLFDGEADTEAVITVVKQLERQRGQKVRLIVGDTLARLSAGANENAGQDMGLVVRRFDRIRNDCEAHFLLIHHSGKAAANGARGWSGIRAAVDTEIEVTDALSGRCAEITKQRDLSTKGQRIGYRLEPVTLGQTKWGAAATSCVVVPADAPEKKAVKRMGEVEGAVIEFLAGQKVGIKKADVAKHFDGRYNRPNVYRAIRTLEAAQAIHGAAGMVCIAGAAR